MIATLIPFSVTILITFTFCILARRPFGECVAATLYSISVILYLSQYLLGTFSPGLWLLVIMGVISIPLFFMMNGGAPQNIKYLVTGGLMAYIGCLVVVSVMDHGRCLYSWDEMMHWGKMVKEMLRLDQFYCVDASTLYRHKDYPPFVALFEYAWCRFGGGYSEAHITQAIHLLNVTLIVPVMFEQFGLKKRKPRTILSYLIKGVLATAVILMVCSFCDPNTNISSIYEDITIGLMFVYSAFLVYRKEYRTRWGAFCYALSLVALIGTKQIGIAFIGLSLLYLVLSALFLSDTAGPKRAGIICAAVSAAAALAYYKSWDMMVARYSGSRQFDLGNNISLSKFLKIMVDSSDRTHRDMLKRFIFALFEKNIASGPIPITYFTSFLIVLLILAALCYLFGDRFPRREQAVLAAVFVVGEGGYAFMMLMLYELCFESEEMTSMHSFPRYMGSFFLSELMLLLLIALWLWGRKSPVWQKTGKMCIAFMLTAVLVAPGKLSFLVPQGVLGDRLYDTRQRGNYITETVREGSTIYLAYERTQGDLEQVRYSYFVDKSWIDHTHYNLAADNLKNVKAEDIEYTLGEDDYVFTVKVTEGINKALSGYNGGQELKDYTLYEILKDNGKITLKEIGGVG